MSIGESFYSTNSIYSGDGTFAANAGISAVLYGQKADSASAAAIILASTANLTTAGAKLVSVRNAVSVEKAAIDKDGMIQLGIGSGLVAKPTCDSTQRGKLWFTAAPPADAGATGADTLDVCRKDAADGYAWVAISIL
jgi:hypothetical protein